VKIRRTKPPRAASTHSREETIPSHNNAAPDAASVVLAALRRAALPTRLPSGRYLAAVTDDYLARTTGLDYPRIEDALTMLTANARALTVQTLAGWPYEAQVRLLLLDLDAEGDR